MKYRKFHLNVRMSIFNCKGDQTLNGLPRSIVESLSLEIFKTGLGTALSNQFLLTLSRVLDWAVSRGAFQPQLFYDFVKFCNLQFKPIAMLTIWTKLISL